MDSINFNKITKALASIYPVKDKKFRFGLALSMALASWGSARAADFPAAIVAPPPPVEYNWTGFYVGFHVGWGTDHFAFPYSLTIPGPFGYTAGTSGIDASGPIGGAQIGFNYQLPFFHLVAGIEIDNSPSAIRGQATVNTVSIFGTPATATFGARFLDFGTVRGRLGYAWGNFMPYLTGGFNYGTVETTYSVFSGGFFNAGSTTATRTGVFPHVGVFGIGAEYAFTPNFTVKAEYLYDFINAHRSIHNPVTGASIQFGTRTMYHIARVGINYKFDWFSPQPTPVVAKY